MGTHRLLSASLPLALNLLLLLLPLSQIMDSLYAHKVDSDYYPAPLQPNRKAPPTHHAACTCRKSVNWRALRSRDKVVTHPPVTDTA